MPSFPSLSSLRLSLLLLVLLAVLPALALILSTAWEQQRQAANSAQEDALRLARVAAADQLRLIEGARSLLVGLAQLSEVQMHNAKACTGLFAEVQKQFPLYLNIGAVRPDGHVFCATHGRAIIDNVADQAFFRRAVAAREFTVSGYRPDPVTGKPALTLSYPAIDRAGETWAVVFAQLDLDWMAQLADKAQLPRDTTITVTDPSGLVLARHPDRGNWVGKSAAQWPVVQAIRRTGGEGTLEAQGLEGTRRLFAFTALSDPRGEAQAFVSIGIPRDAALADADRLLIRNLLSAGLVVVMMLIAAAIVSDLFILRRVDAVVRAARRLTAGDLAARATVRGVDEIGVMGRTFNIMAERLQTRARDEEAIKERLAERVNELDLLNRMGELFQACLTLQEAYAVIGRLAPRLFPTEAGAVFALSQAGNLIEVVAMWGPHPVDGSQFPPEACWAMRNGRTHAADDTRTSVLCEHLPTPLPPAYVCTPLVAQGNLLGVLYVASVPGDDHGVSGLNQARQRLTDMVAAQLGLGLSNVQLREILRNQSIHDPLTGLFNRRYMAETLEREIHRARRLGNPLALLMADVDGFKQQNDAFGHDAGDAILVELASLLQKSLRKEDVACRYGGEEFVLVLPDAAMENAVRRAEQLQDAVRRIRVPHKDAVLGPITISIGVAAFPDHGTDGASLLKSADMALYQAKKAGRDRVTPASPPEDWPVRQ
ncbi:MAG TPA: diguanylate cyclase [Candidatus Methylomirabilis sp.]|nr:diguanylate cyclase [Candidatus Methylomirabilis sp.]